MAMNQPQARLRHMKISAFIFAATVVIFGLLWGKLVWHKLQNARIQTISARLTSARNVIWDDAHIDINAIQPELQRSADLLRSHGFKPRLLIEHYSDTLDADIAVLTRIGHEAGFDLVDTQAHNWASPPFAEGHD